MLQIETECSLDDIELADILATPGHFVLNMPSSEANDSFTGESVPGSPSSKLRRLTLQGKGSERLNWRQCWKWEDLAKLFLGANPDQLSIVKTRFLGSGTDMKTRLPAAAREWVLIVHGVFVSQRYSSGIEWTQLGIGLNAKSLTDAIYDKIISTYLDLYGLAPSPTAATDSALRKLQSKLQDRYSTKVEVPHEHVSAAFHRDQHHRRDVITPVYREVVSSFEQFDSSVYFSPYTSVVGPSGIGKSFVIAQIARLQFTYVIYLCTAKSSSKVYPPRSVITDRIFEIIDRDESTKYFECFIAASMAHVELCKEHKISPRAFYEFQAYSEYHEFQKAIADKVDALFHRAVAHNGGSRIRSDDIDRDSF